MTQTTEKKPSRKAREQAERDAAIAELREMFPPGSEVPVVLRHCARSGMMRAISTLSPGYGDVSYLVARATGYKVHQKYGGVVMGGCGMDMGFALVYALSRTLYPAGFGCIGEGAERRSRCPSNDHSNGDRDYTPHVDDCPQSTAEVGTDIPRRRAYQHWHKDGGYALHQRWV